MSLRLPFVTLDVFTTERFLGNPVAIVRLGPDEAARLTQPQKQRIAREFNLSETVFLHTAEGPAEAGASSRRVEIFTITEELPFAGHPTIGSACYVLNELGWTHVDTLAAKAGPIRVAKVPGGGKQGSVRASIPHDVHIHARTLGELLASGEAYAKAAIEPALSLDPAIRQAELAAPPVSIVRGMTFLMVELPSLEHLAKVSTGPGLDFAKIPGLLDEGPWRESFVCRYYYVPQGTGTDGQGTTVWKGQARMVELGFEDPATGSAACTLASFLTLTGQARAGGDGEGIVGFEIVQGEEMGRRSEIELQVRSETADGQTRVIEVFLGGSAVPVMEGTVFV